MRLGSLLKFQVFAMAVSLVSALAIAEDKTKQLKKKDAASAELTWLRSPDLKFDDLTPDGLKRKTTLVDFLGPYLVYSEYRLGREELAKGCRGRGLYLLEMAKERASEKVIESPLLECVVNLKVSGGVLYVQTRDDAGDRLLTLGRDLNASSLTVALADNFDGDKSHLASARRKLKIDLLRKSGSIGVKRTAPARLILSFSDRRVDILWLISDQKNYVCLSDAFSLPEGVPLSLEPTRIPCKTSTARHANDFALFPSAGWFIFWQGNRGEMGRIEHIVGERSTSIGSESVVDPLNWVSVSAAEFSIHYAGNVATSAGGFFNFETGNLNFDDPYVYFFDLKTYRFHRLAFLSSPNFQVLWIREKNDGILVSMIDSNSEKPKLVFISPSAKGDTVENL